MRRAGWDIGWNQTSRWTLEDWRALVRTAQESGVVGDRRRCNCARGVGGLRSFPEIVISLH